MPDFVLFFGKVVCLYIEPKKRAKEGKLCIISFLGHLPLKKS